MKVTGIIAEFNPFHNGHEYIINAAKELTGADYCLIVMSGDFVQRGEPAICDKYLRTRMALSSGADAVFELPTVYSCASAEHFAHGAMLLLSELGCVDEVCFGSESGDIGSLMKVAEILAGEPEEYKAVLSDGLRSGLSFPAARQKALEVFLKEDNGRAENKYLYEQIRNGLISSPNNILAIEYCKAYIRLSRSGIHAPRPVTVNRSGSDYNSLSPDTAADASALALREFIKTGDITRIKPFVPTAVYSMAVDGFNRIFPVYPEDFDPMLYIKLQDLKDRAGSSDAARLADGYSAVPSDMLNSIFKHIDEPISFRELAEKVKTRNYTYTSVCRALISILLGPVPDVQGIPSVHLPYARLLGIREQSSELIRAVNGNSSCRIINKLADANTDSPLFIQDIKAARLYNQIVYKKFGTRLPDEYRKTIEIC